MGKADGAFSAQPEIFDTTIGWRFVNPLMKAQYGVDSMPETGENVAEQYQISRADQDASRFAASRSAGARRRTAGFAEEIVAGDDRARKGEPRSSAAGRASARRDRAREAGQAATPFRETARSPRATPRA